MLAHLFACRTHFHFFVVDGVILALSQAWCLLGSVECIATFFTITESLHMK